MKVEEHMQLWNSHYKNYFSTVRNFLFKFRSSVATKILVPELSISMQRTFAASSIRYEPLPQVLIFPVACRHFIAFI